VLHVRAEGAGSPPRAVPLSHAFFSGHAPPSHETLARQLF
jgi:hypothetical protein